MTGAVAALPGGAVGVGEESLGFRSPPGGHRDAGRGGPDANRRHSLAVTQRLFGQRRGLVGIVVDQQFGQPGQSGCQPLDLAGLFGAGDGVPVGRDRGGDVATQALDLGELKQPVADEPRAERLPPGGRRGGIRGCLLEPSQTAQGLGPVRQRERGEGRETGEIRESPGDLQLAQCLGVRALLEMVGGPVAANPDLLDDVVRPLGVLECFQIVRVVGAAVAVERREHGEDGVRGGQRRGVPECGRPVERVVRQRGTAVAIPLQPQHRRGQRGADRRVPGGLAMDRAPPVEGERIVEFAPQMLDEPKAVGDGGVERRGGSHALEQPASLGPVAAVMMGHTGQTEQVRRLPQPFRQPLRVPGADPWADPSVATRDGRRARRRGRCRRRHPPRGGPARGGRGRRTTRPLSAAISRATAGGATSGVRGSRGSPG
jgi:hypothetical protein